MLFQYLCIFYPDSHSMFSLHRQTVTFCLSTCISVYMYSMYVYMYLYMTDYCFKTLLKGTVYCTTLISSFIFNLSSGQLLCLPVSCGCYNSCRVHLCWLLQPNRESAVSERQDKTTYSLKNLCSLNTNYM